MLTLVICAALSVTPAQGQSPLASKATLLETRLSEAIERYKISIGTARTHSQRVKELERLTSYLGRDAGRLKAATMAEQRRLHFTIEGLKIYLEKINRREVLAGQCELSRLAILHAADPKSDASAPASGEAREALAVLDLLCR